MGRVSTYTLLEDMVSYSGKECVGKHILLKDIPSIIGGPLKEKDVLEVKKVKDVSTYADVVYEMRATDRLSKEEEGIKFKNFLENSLFLK